MSDSGSIVISARMTWHNSAIDWQMGAALQNVLRGDSELPQVSGLAGAVCEWTTLSGEMQAGRS